MAVLIAIPIMGVLAILQSSLVSRLPLLQGTPDLVMLAIIAWALQKRVQTAWQWSIIGGLVVSFYSAASNRSSCVACPAGVDGVEFETIDPGFIVLPATLDANPVSAVLDSGSGHSGINVNAATALGVNLPPMAPGAPSGHGFGLQTGPVRLGDTILSERATLHVMDHPVMESLGLKNRPTMLLGTDQLRDRTLTICYGLKRLFVL